MPAFFIVLWASGQLAQTESFIAAKLAVETAQNIATRILCSTGFVELGLSKKNLTLALEGDLLDKVRVIAAFEKTTVNALVRDFLTDLAESKSRTARARKRLADRSRRATGKVGTKIWSREALYER